MESKVWLTIFGVVSLLLIGAAGFFCFSSSQAYSEARQGWDSKIGTIRSLEGRTLYPNQDNVDALKEDVGEYNKSVETLFAALDQFQKPLNKALANIDFQDFVKSKVTEFRQHASASNFSIEAGEDFQLGFDAYSNTVPTPEIVPILDYELKAIDYLLRELIASGAESMSSFSRDLIPGEVGGPEAQENGVVHKYPVRIGFRTSHSAFQRFINKISNDKEYFYIIRVLRVMNDQMEGPVKGGGESASGFPRYENPVTQEVASVEQLEAWGFELGAPLPADLTEKAKADGFVPSGKDARVLMGQEKLDVFMVVDIVRFLDPSEVVEPESSSRDRGRRGSRDR